MMVKLKGSNNVWKVKKIEGVNYHLIPTTEVWGLFCIVDKSMIEKQYEIEKN